MYDNLPELIKEYPIGTIVPDVIKGERLKIGGYLYDGKMWHPVIQWLDGWFTMDQLKNKI